MLGVLVREDLDIVEELNDRCMAICRGIRTNRNEVGTHDRVQRQSIDDLARPFREYDTNCASELEV